ncbi:hypothetical protein [Candidatus Reidiella endopervernicosa]|uniref:Uncharacterized protein n=1 Tax=Candidatus Reidiella endopervernicosa TaxID=2738883 RepID=A0A6N0HYA2_9GAMM|nr:hypothetical protein [Candidatus Reidiella endopervernicosa]QKQ27186.1 hypothetical protein HUE57_13470 [Candidatus Reidiella endopervernicosa]
MQQFVPVTDEIVFDHPEDVADRLVPFSLDYPCHHWLEASNGEEQEPTHDE